MFVTFQTADAVAAALNNTDTAAFSQTFTAIRKTIPTHKLQELAELKVIVVPNAVEIQKATRCQDMYTVSVDVGIQKKIGTDIETEVVVLSELTGEIVDYLTRRPLTDMPSLAWHKTQNAPIYDVQMLEQMRVYLSVVTVSYQGLGKS